MCTLVFITTKEGSQTKFCKKEMTTKDLATKVHTMSLILELSILTLLGTRIDNSQFTPFTFAAVPSIPLGLSLEVKHARSG